MTNQTLTLSTNHVEIIGEFEFFTDTNGNLYRARLSNALDINGFRLGGRFEAPPHMVEALLETHREYANNC
jgi:hypothetical protein